MVFLRMVMAASIAGLSAFGCDEEEELFGDSVRLYFHNQMTQTTGGSSDDVRADLFVDNQNSPLVSDRGYPSLAASAATASNWMMTVKALPLMRAVPIRAAA